LSTYGECARPPYDSDGLSLAHAFFHTGCDSFFVGRGLPWCPLPTRPSSQPLPPLRHAAFSALSLFASSLPSLTYEPLAQPLFHTSEPEPLRL
jgi:hypothetical protein